MQAILGTKIDQTQKFLKDGTRIPVTRLWILGNTVVAVKTKDKSSHSSVQLGFGINKHANKALLGHIKGASLKAAPKFLKEVKIENGEVPEIGTVINPIEIFKPGDIVNVTGVSKGKGYAGVVKRHHFKGGPRTHGQSDRERAPGSIGQTTTPGRVYKGKRMAGRMGHEKVTVKNLQVIGVTEDTLLIKGLVPGGKNTLIKVTKVGESKKFVPLFGAEEPAGLPISDDVKQEKGAEVTHENFHVQNASESDLKNKKVEGANAHSENFESSPRQEQIEKELEIDEKKGKKGEVEKQEVENAS